MKKTEKLNIIMSDNLTTKPEHLRGTSAILCKILIIGVTILNHLRGVRLTLEVRLWDTAVTEPPDVFWPIVALLISTKWDCVCLQGAANTLTALPPHADTIQSCSLNHPKNTQKYQNFTALKSMYCVSVLLLAPHSGFFAAVLSQRPDSISSQQLMCLLLELQEALMWSLIC